MAGILPDVVVPDRWNIPVGVSPVEKVVALFLPYWSVEMKSSEKRMVNQ